MKNTLKVLFLFCTLTLFQFSLKGQDSTRKGSWLTLDLHYGFIMPLYTSSMNILIQGHVPAFELDYMNKPACKNNWLSAYHCPETGIAFFSAYMNNPAQLGMMYGAYPFINFHLKRGFKEGLYFRFGIGLGYMPVIFNRLTNHKNDVIGSHIDAMFNFRFNYHFYLSDKIRLETGLGLTHCSNGAFKTPNLGINLITANTGLSYYLTSPKYCPIKTFIDTTKTKKIENVLFATAGLSEIEPPGGRQYPDFTLSYIGFRKLNCKGKLGLGLDIFYNEANIARMNSDTAVFKNNINNTQIGLKAAYEITLDKLSLPLEMGAYLYTRYLENGYIYNRIGLRYYAGKHIIANLTLLTHFAKADFIEWGIGYKL
jgi:hypothetical protein